MYLRVGLLMIVLTIACASAPPSVGPVELFVNYDSGGVWPTIGSVRIFEDGTLSLGDGASQVRRRVRADDEVLLRIRAALRDDAFRNELNGASVRSSDWRSSGAWIRVERGNVVGLIKPPITARHIHAVFADIDVLFGRVFGRRYQPLVPGQQRP